MTKKTLVLAYPGCILFEVMLATELLHPAYPVFVATPNGEPLINSNGMKVSADLSFRDIQVANCACLLVPGGDPTEAVENSDIDTVLQNAYAQNLWIGGIWGGCWCWLKQASYRDDQSRILTQNAMLHQIRS
jgi:4-methyl-5(b-hydroxyethyl)-thiazole monophosphate biosynthesis